MFVLHQTLLLAQNTKTVSGLVKGADGNPLPSVSINLKGTNINANTNENGKYSINVQGDNPVLIFSLVGLLTKEVAVGNANTLNIILDAVDSKEMEGVVVTALGIKREQKALGYAFQEIKGDVILERRETNLANALTGQVAGLQVIRGSNGPAGSSKLVLRGFNSLTGSNQPLIVVDGIPMDNFTGSQNNDFWNPATDMGNGLADLNPDDIESMSILKGGAASALYGSRAGNGVILITTKKGAKRAGLGVTYSATVGVETLFMQPELQSAFGQGSNFIYNTLEGRSWGPKIEGQDYTKWDNTIAKMTAYDNMGNFFKTGINNTHNLSFQQKISNSTSIYTSGTYMHDDSRIPGAKLDRLNLTTRLVSSYGASERLTTDFKVQYINNKATNRPLSGSNTGNYFGQILTLPRSFDVRDLEPGVDANNNHFYYLPIDQSSAVNPYWNYKYNQNTDSRDRFLLNGLIKYKFNDWLVGEIRGGADIYNTKSQSKLYASSPIMLNGRYAEGSNTFTEKNFISSLTASKANLFGKLGGSLGVYGQIMNRKQNYLSANSGELEVPNLFSVNNGKNPPSVEQFISEKQINSLFGNFEINYDGYWFLNLTYRNDWSSTLSKENRSYVYPSISTSLVLSELITKNGNNLPKWLSFAKLRGSYATIGNDLEPYQLLNTYKIEKDANGNTISRRENVLNNPNIVSELIKNFEVGVESKFLNNRIGVDFTFYKSNATNQILRIPMNPLSGYEYRRLNAGNIENKGIELVLNARILEQSNSFTWDMTFNFAKNKNKIIDLYEDVNTYLLGGYDNVTINAVKGQYYGDIWGVKFNRVTDVTSANYGKLILNNQGLPTATSQTSRLGNQLPKAILGLSNTFKYKDFSFSFLIDARLGGEIFSATNFFLQTNGLAAKTVKNGGREEFIVDGVVVVDPASPDPNKPNYLTNSTKVSHQNYWGAIAVGNLGITEANIYDATNIRLRNVALNYTIPSHLLNNCFINRAKIGFSVNNVWMLKSHLNGIDPESVYATGTNAIGFESLAPPTGRSYFLNIAIGL